MIITILQIFLRGLDLKVWCVNNIANIAALQHLVLADVLANCETLQWSSSHRYGKRHPLFVFSWQVPAAMHRVSPQHAKPL